MRAISLRAQAISACEVAALLVDASCRRDLQRPTSVVGEGRLLRLNDQRPLCGQEADVNGLRKALVTRAVIERCKGMLMLREKGSAPEALELLERTSRNSNIKRRDLAV